MHRLYQWLSKSASFFRTDLSSSGVSRIVRTEVTVERQAMTLLVNGGSVEFDRCPLCGQELTPAQTEQARLRLQKHSTSQAALPIDGDPP